MPGLRHPELGVPTHRLPVDEVRNSIGGNVRLLELDAALPCRAFRPLNVLEVEVARWKGLHLPFMRFRHSAVASYPACL